MAEPSSYCGGAYRASSKYWEAKPPSVATVLARLPSAKRKQSGNVTTLDYGNRADGKPVHSGDFDRQWQYIFGTSTGTGHGRLLRGRMPSGAASSWGRLSKAHKRNLSECVVDGKDAAICLGIPSGSTNVSSLGHHTGWAILDPASLPGSTGTRACLVYEVLFSSNFDFRSVDGKLPGFADPKPGVSPPNDHLCQGTSLLRNDGKSFSTRLGFTDNGGSSKQASLKLSNNFRNDHIGHDCRSDGNGSNNEFMTGMHGVEVTNSAQAIGTGVWYRLEHELVLNDRFETRQDAKSGAISKVWLYHGGSTRLLRSLEMKDSFRFDSNRDGRFENYPLLPRASTSQKITGIFLSIQQGGNLTGSGPWELDHVIALRNFGLFYR